MALTTRPVHVNYPDDILLKLGTDGDIVLVHRSTALGSSTALTNVLVGTPVTTALAANSLILSNVTAEGDIMIAVNRGGNSTEMVFIDASAERTFLHGSIGGRGSEAMTFRNASSETFQFRDITSVRGIDLTLSAAGDQTIGSITAATLVLKNLKNSAASALSGTQLDIQIDLNGTPYYFTVFPTKA